MTPIFCESCGKGILSTADPCPHCGFLPLPPPEPPALDPYFPLFPVSTTKFVVMSTFTFSFYYLYWIYANWSRISYNQSIALSPFWRMFFSGIWNFSLFGQIRDLAWDRQIEVGWNPILFAVLTLIGSLLGRADGPLGLVATMTFLLAIPINQTAQKINAHHSGTVAEPRNDRFSGWNIACVIIGAILWGLALLGTALETLRHTFLN
jgi:hypothetical protein